MLVLLLVLVALSLGHLLHEEGGACVAAQCQEGGAGQEHQVEEQDLPALVCRHPVRKWGPGVEGPPDVTPLSLYSQKTHLRHIPHAECV